MKHFNMNIFSENYMEYTMGTINLQLNNEKCTVKYKSLKQTKCFKPHTDNLVLTLLNAHPIFINHHPPSPTIKKKKKKKEVICSPQKNSIPP